jgi:hypothetical protein
MKRVFLICVIGMALCVSGVFAEHSSDKFGIGVQGGGGGGLGGYYGGDLTLKFPKLPIFWGVNINGAGLGVSGDGYFIDKEFAPRAHLGVYVGGGIYGRFSIWKGWGELTVGAELPIGLSWQPLRFFELYLQAVPYVGVGIGNGIWIDGFIGGNLGLRFWI